MEEKYEEQEISRRDMEEKYKKQWTSKFPEIFQTFKDENISLPKNIFTFPPEKIKVKLIQLSKKNYERTVQLILKLMKRF